MRERTGFLSHADSGKRRIPDMIPGRAISGVLLALLCAPALMAQVSPPAGAVTGVVYDATTNQPVAGAIVTLARLDGGQPIPRSVTDSRGRFVFRNLEPSTQYYLGARRFGYEYTRYGWTGPNQSLTISDIARIAVSKDQWVDGIRIPLWRTGSISGRVTDERGEPLVGVAVRVFSLANISGQQQLVAGDIATTDDLGMYRIGGLQPGKYSVAVLSVQSTVLQSTSEAPSTLAIGQLATGGIGGSRGATVSMPTIDIDGRHRLVVTNFATPPPPSAQEGRAYPATFYPGAVSVADAVPIDISYGDGRTGIDVQVRPVAAVRVSGRLTTPTGEPAPQLLLRLMPLGAERLGFGSEAATTTVDTDGSFVFLNVPAAQYTLMAQASVMDFTSGTTERRFPDAPGFPGGGISVGSADGAPGLEYLARYGAPSGFWGRASVAVGARDVTDVVVPLRRTSTIHGRLVLPDGLSLPPEARIVLSVEPANGDPAIGQASGAVNVAQPDRPFTIEGLLGGHYLIRGISSNAPSLLSSVRIASVTWHGRDVRHTGIDTSNTEDIRDVVVTLTDKKIEIKGTVSDGNGPAVAGVIAFPVDRSRWTNFGWHPSNLATTRSGSTGAFSFDRLPQGEYYLVAVDRSQLESWVDPKFLAAAVPFAARVSVTWGDTRTQDLTVVKVVVK